MRNQLALLALVSLLLGSCSNEKEATRERIDFNSGWQFILRDSSGYREAAFPDGQWRTLDLPHDWSIEGSFSKDHPAGTGGGALPGGIGWYRKSFTLPPGDSGKIISINFDGVYRNSEVYLNGQLLGKRPNGYIGFSYVLNPYLLYGETENVLAVRVDNSMQPNSRWYSGSGIYRNVWLEKTHPIHVAHWGTHVYCNPVDSAKANIHLSTVVENRLDEDKSIVVETRILDPGGREVARQNVRIELPAGGKDSIKDQLEISEPRLWSIGEPQLYTAETTLRSDREVLDHYETPFGIRSFHFDPAAGFILNGKPLKIKGVCMHHDLGALGAAVNKRAMERQLEILKEMGCNGIRTSHNPPAPEWLDLCDRMGFIVMDETFDMWKMKKSPFDYALDWDQWYRRDLEDHLRRDRNHPSVFSWSIGNEILEQWDSSGTAMAAELAAIVHAMAPGIPVTAGCNNPDPGNFLIRSGDLDLIGFNYQQDQYESFPENFPGTCFIASETTSALQSRGSYDMPSDSLRIWPVRWDIPFHDGNPDNSCSAYDNCRVPWGSTHEESWALIKEHDFLSGMYIWTGFDYLGEPTPYGWPSRSSYFGIVDLAGFPKDVYYMYKSEWTDEEVLHIFPHWNWEEGEEVDVWAYTSYPEVELFINGVSRGKIRKEPGDLHLQWRCIFEPGELMALGTGKDGSRKEVRIHTAGKAAKISLEADRDHISSGGSDLSFITVQILDGDGNPVPGADPLLHFQIEGDASLAGVDNGQQTSHHHFKGDEVKAYHGKALVIVRSGSESGKATLTASAAGLEDASLDLTLVQSY